MRKSLGRRDWWPLTAYLGGGSNCTHASHPSKISATGSSWSGAMRGRHIRRDRVRPCRWVKEARRASRLSGVDGRNSQIPSILRWPEVRHLRSLSLGEGRLQLSNYLIYLITFIHLEAKRVLARGIRCCFVIVLVRPE